MLPKHIWEEHAGDAAAEFENLEMVGSGPFKLVEYQPNQFARLEAVKDHFLYPPKVDGAVIQTFSNQDSLVQALRTGQVDMITEMPSTAVPGLRNADNIELVTGPRLPLRSPTSSSTRLRPRTAHEDGVCQGHPAPVTATVALAHATDKQKIIELLLGLGTGLTLIPDSLACGTTARWRTMPMMSPRPTRSWTTRATRIRTVMASARCPMARSR